MADITREEQYLSAIANGSTDVPEPVTREEQYLYQIAVNGGGGGGGGASSADKVSYDNTTSGLTATNVQAAIDEVAQGGGGGGGDATADLTLVAVASGITTSGSYNTQAITGFTSFALTANKGFDTLLAKARTKRLSIDGGVSWIADGVATIADVNVHEQSVYPKEALSQLGLVTNKDAIFLTLSSIYKRGDQTDRELELYLRFTPAMRLIYEDTNGTMQIIDPSQGG